uniref:Uncharacterized protein n=1 Tax=Knipowitschia caucasica TaxID=637954 RepID=A0AAV2LRE3_KNICA
MNIRPTVPMDLLPVFLASAADLVHVLAKKVWARKRGKRGGLLVRLRRRGARTALPGIFLSNVRSLGNKMDELSLLMRRNKDFATSCVLCFTETWLNERIPDCALELQGFGLFRADRHCALSGKSRGGGLCFYTETKALETCSEELQSVV